MYAYEKYLGSISETDVIETDFVLDQFLTGPEASESNIFHRVTELKNNGFNTTHRRWQDKIYTYRKKGTRSRNKNEIYISLLCAFKWCDIFN